MGKTGSARVNYVKSILQPHETVKAVGHMHWVRYVPALGLALAALALSLLGQGAGNFQGWFSVAALLVLAAAVVTGARAWFVNWITEVAVTNLRVIYKTGFINRHTAEMNMDKVESVVVDQTLLGRLLGYGTLHVRGVGEGIEHLHHIADPIALRNAIVAR
jgi:uncharacterized membrane protein YdbT with pleckstrin-like domain